jgi:hypothetical protein
MKRRLETLLTHLIEQQATQNARLDKIAALLISQQLLTECIDHRGTPRDAETCAEIVGESFSAGLCLLGELEQRNKNYLYQQQEFFIEETDENYDGGEDSDDDDDEPRSNSLVNSF